MLYRHQQSLSLDEDLQHAFTKLNNSSREKHLANEIFNPTAVQVEDAYLRSS
jgi:hypothetical protein